MSNIFAEKVLTLPYELLYSILDNIPDEYLMQYIDFPTIGKVALDILSSNVIIFKESPRLIEDYLTDCRIEGELFPRDNSETKHSITFDLYGVLRFIVKYPHFRPHRLYVYEISDFEILRRICKWIVDEAKSVSISRRFCLGPELPGIVSECSNIDHLSTSNCQDVLAEIPSTVTEITYRKVSHLNPFFRPLPVPFLRVFPEHLINVDICVEVEDYFIPKLPNTLKRMHIEFSRKPQRNGEERPMGIDIEHLNNLHTASFEGIHSLAFGAFKAPKQLRNLHIEACTVHGDWRYLAQLTNLRSLQVAAGDIYTNIIAEFPTSLTDLVVDTETECIAETFEFPPRLVSLYLDHIELPVSYPEIQFPHTLKNLHLGLADKDYLLQELNLPELETLTLEANVLHLRILPKSLREFSYRYGNFFAAIRSELKEYTNLTSLSFNGLKLVGLDCRMPPNLENLDLRNNWLPEILLDYTKIRKLYACRNKLPHLNKASLKLPEGLLELHLNETDLHKEGEYSTFSVHPPVYEPCFPESLEFLSLGDSNITDAILNKLELSRCTKLKELSLHANYISSLSSRDFPKSLVFLDISSNRIKKIVDGDLSGFKSLRGINASNNTKLGSGLVDKPIVFPQSLEYINLSACRIPSNAVQNLVVNDCKNLKWVFLLANKPIPDLSNFLDAVQRFCPLISSVHVDDKNYIPFRSMGFSFLDRTYDHTLFQALKKRNLVSVEDGARYFDEIL
ncbi:uncharacterized protein J8A68_004002 [[Candida] subhashii]|uniref:Uncharacterized protein n=1 Tax=[Candida] subhashii TaxID=561895 RepID=A0A8J5QK59_9ASCO|nr:uncharacterized protein J8A68_004002 [[Candida] subhashii]KAG7662471.1 hypothetical protein J8A68_004002 [[Candida] subhashii]